MRPDCETIEHRYGYYGERAEIGHGGHVLRKGENPFHFGCHAPYHAAFTLDWA